MFSERESELANKDLMCGRASEQMVNPMIFAYSPQQHTSRLTSIQQDQFRMSFFSNHSNHSNHSNGSHQQT